MKTVTTRAALRQALSGIAAADIGFVPTMGALHRGHISLVERARGENATVVASIFVNPTQFNDPEDLRTYPRDVESDLRMLEGAGADIVFVPESVEEIYPEPDDRVFDFGDLDRVMEGATRPGHFNGVAQVVTRLFEMVRPARAYFGQKDFQQVAVIRALVRMEGFAINIVECPIVREADGLAMSSRNALLEPQYRAAAPGIYAALRAGVDLVRAETEAGREISPREVERFITARVDEGGLLKTIYCQLVNCATLQPAARWDEAEGVRGCIAVQAGRVRLIDNIGF